MWMKAIYIHKFYCVLVFRIEINSSLLKFSPDSVTQVNKLTIMIGAALVD